MWDYLLIYLAIGIAVVALFHKPLRDKIVNFSFFASFDDLPRWKVIVFGAVSYSNLLQQLQPKLEREVTTSLKYWLA